MEDSSPLKKALDISTNRIISACAGAGKTYALSKRYCAILDEFTKRNLIKTKNEWLGFKNILVITFTNKAAAEMSRRIYKDLQILLRGEEIQELKAQGVSLGQHIRHAPEKYKNWLRSTFSQNYIMTIDAFCGTVLREHAYLLNIDPQFKTSDELLAQKLYRETLNEFLNRQSKALRPELKRILQYTDKNGIIQFFNYFDKNKVFLEEWLAFVEKHSDEDIYQRWLDLYLPEFDVDLLEREATKITQNYEFIKEGETNSLVLLKDKLERMPEDTEQERRRYFMAEILPYFLTHNKTYYKGAWSVQKKSSFIEEHVATHFKENTEDLLEIIQTHIPENKVLLYPSLEDKISIKVFKDLITLYADFEDALWKTQTRKNYLTFNDVIIKTRELLTENENVRKQYSDQFKHILVDEFQDTNSLRWDIIKQIAKKEDGNLREKGLFIVGDKKQSIYRFQQADVEVINVAQKELETVTPEALISFNENYRSTRTYIDHVINPLFTKIFTEPAFDFEASFEKTTFPPNRKEEIIDTEHVCDISFVEEDPTQDGYYTPAYHAAYLARQYLSWAEKQKIESDVFVGVLLRNFIHIHEYLRAFQELDIPFQIIGEKNLFNQQETYDLFHFISVLINLHDDTALVGLLRSPFFCAEDTLVYRCKKRNKEQSIFSYISHESEYESTVQTIQQWRQLAQKLSVNELLHDILSDAHRELGYVSEVGGRQRLANLDKLLHVIKKLELDGASMQELHDYLAYQIRYKSEVAQADIPEPAKVQILTIHKAKGLEFPTVILPELDHIKTQAEKGNIFHSRIAPDGRIEVGISIKEQIESKKSNLLEIIKKQDKIEQEAEDKRMFYVAVTRAKYRIGLLAEYTGNYNKNSWWASFVATPLGLPKSSEKLMNEEIPYPPLYRISCISNDELKDHLARETFLEKKIATWNPPVISQPAERYKRITPHDIMQSIDEGEFFDETTTEIPSDTGLLFGTIFHTIIERHWWKWEDNTSQVEDFIRNNYPAFPYDELQSRLREHLNNFTSSDLYQKLKKDQTTHLFHEHPVIGWMDNGEIFYEVNGVIDLMFKDDHDWTIVDFKTDQSTQFHEQYTIQLQTYLWMIKQLYNIEATAYIYYSAFNELRKISFSNDYWSVIFSGEKHPFTPSALHKEAIEPDILKSITHEPCAIINMTMFHTTRMLQTLAAMKKLNPGIQVTTLNRLLISSSEKRLTPPICRMLVRKAGERYDLSEGIVDLLAQAFIEHQKQGIIFESDNRMFNEIYQKIEILRVQHRFSYESEILEKVLKEKLSDATIILNAFFKDDAKNFSMMKTVAYNARYFYFIDCFKNNSLHSSFDYTHQIWEGVEPNKSSGQSCTAYHSVETEIEGIAQKILELKEDILYEDMQLAISSIDVYIPIVERVFTAYGIPHRIYAPYPIVNHPLTVLITGLLTIMLSSEHLNWQTLSSVLLHPLMPEDENLFKLDAFIRTKPIVYFSDVADACGIENYRETIHHICDWIASLELNPEKDEQADIWRCVADFLDEHNIDSKHERDEDFTSVFSHLQKIVTTTTETNKIIGFPDKKDDILREFKRQIKDAEIPRKHSGKGVDVISYLESYESRAEVLFVAGLAEDYFPVPVKKNPFTKSLPHFEWQKSAFLLNSWLRRQPRTYMSCPCKNMSGDVLNPSILLEGITIEKEPTVKDSIPFTLRQYYIACEDHIIENPQLPVIKRHNDYLSKDIGPYKGQVKPDGSDTILISASSMNNLIQCPMQYLFQNILKINLLEYDEDAELRKNLGTNIHKALERFGNADGFIILKDNFGQACSLLDRQLRKVLHDNQIHPEHDLFLHRLYSPYLGGLEEADENNLLVNLLMFTRENFDTCTPFLFEQDFGKHEKSGSRSWPIYQIRNEVVRLHFRGTIDKISRCPSEQIILASDYKTGKASSINDIEQYWDVQPLIYMLALEDHYIKENIRFMYESIKDIATSRNPFIILLNEKEFMLKWKSRNEDKERLISRDEFRQLLLLYGEKVILGNFNIRERERNRKPCNYCLYYLMCRKNSCITTCTEINTILQNISEEQS